MLTLLNRVSLGTALAVLAAMALIGCGKASEAKDLTFQITVADRQVEGGAQTYVATNGDTVTVTIASDEPAEVHLHGYDLEQTTDGHSPATISFVADADGRFPIEMHFGAAHSHAQEPNHCNVDATGVAVDLHVMPGTQAGEYILEIDTENFDLSGGNHWHLAVDGAIVGMYSEPTKTVTIGEGAHELVATLSDVDHCELPVSDTVTVGEGTPTHPADDDGHEHDVEEATIAVGTLEVRPR
jgi:hypothetical protein